VFSPGQSFANASGSENTSMTHEQWRFSLLGSGGRWTWVSIRLLFIPCATSATPSGRRTLKRKRASSIPTHSPREIGRCLVEAGFKIRGAHDAETLLVATGCPRASLSSRRKAGEGCGRGRRAERLVVPPSEVIQSPN